MAAWEAGEAARGLERPAALLAALSGRPLDEALDADVARRDRELMGFRRALFGADWGAFAECPACAAPLEYAVPAPPLAGDPDEPVHEGWRLRHPSTRDVVEAACAGREGAAVLKARCFDPKMPEALHDGAEQALEDAHAALFSLDLACADCGARWTIAFDAGAFVWREVRAEARRLALEVATLSRAFGWREADILAMSQTRRNAYLAFSQ